MTTNSDSKRLAEIRERLEKATDGPWKAIDSDYETEWSVHGSEIIFDGNNVGDGYYASPSEDDAKFIAHSREDTPWLVKIVDALLPAAQRGIEYSQWKAHWREAAKAAVRELGEGK